MSKPTTQAPITGTPTAELKTWTTERLQERNREMRVKSTRPGFIAPMHWAAESNQAVVRVFRSESVRIERILRSRGEKRMLPAIQYPAWERVEAAKQAWDQAVKQREAKTE